MLWRCYYPPAEKMEGEMDDGGTEPGVRRVKVGACRQPIEGQLCNTSRSNKNTLNTVQSLREPCERLNMENESQDLLTLRGSAPLS